MKTFVYHTLLSAAIDSADRRPHRQQRYFLPRPRTQADIDRIAKAALKQLRKRILRTLGVHCTPPTSPGESSDVLRAGEKLGSITCDSPGKWYGKNTKSPGHGFASWATRSTPEQAIQDVVDAADGKEVEYVKLCQQKGACTSCEKGGQTV